MENPFFDFLRRSGGGGGSSYSSPAGTSSDPILQILQSYGGRQGVGFSLQRLAEIASLGLGRAEGAYRDLPSQIGALYAQPRQDVLSSFGGQFQDTADRQAALQSRLDQQFGRSGLGSLRGTQTAALEQQAQRQNLGTRDALSRQLASIGLAKAGAQGAAYGMLPGFLERRSGVERGIAEAKTQHIVARKQQKAEKNNALLGALGSLGGAALGAFGGPAGAAAGASLGDQFLGSYMSQQQLMAMAPFLGGGYWNAPGR